VIRPLARRTLILVLLAAACGRDPAPASDASPTGTTGSVADPLPSWHDGATKRAIVDFVEDVTRQGDADFVPQPERIATFDNDGTLWSEQPIYVQAAFALDRVKALAPQHPEWRQRQPFKGIIEGDLKAAAASGEKGLLEVIAATHAGNTTEEFAGIVSDWITTARHPQIQRPYTELVYKPMVELLAYLRAKGFKTFIVSGGGVEFMRPWTDRVYGVPPEQVVGSRAKVQYAVKDGKPELHRLPHVDSVDDKEGKPVGIHQLIGRRPLAAFGNSDGDFEMLEWTTTGPGRRLGLIVHHTDGERESAYDRHSHVGQLARALDEAPARGWLIADMKRDWTVVFPFER
jgi:phosphoglycolate phosphatase-like HAD superfamily hydrolase